MEKMEYWRFQIDVKSFLILFFSFLSFLLYICYPCKLCMRVWENITRKFTWKFTRHVFEIGKLHISSHVRNNFSGIFSFRVSFTSIPYILQTGINQDIYVEKNRIRLKDEKIRGDKAISKNLCDRLYVQVEEESEWAASGRINQPAAATSNIATFHLDLVHSFRPSFYEPFWSRLDRNIRFEHIFETLESLNHRTCISHRVDETRCWEKLHHI